MIDRHKLFKDFEEIRQTGISADREESIRGGICFGAALRPEGRPMVAAISISTPTTRMSSELEKDIKAALLVAAERVANLLKDTASVPRALK